MITTIIANRSNEDTTRSAHQPMGRIHESETLTHPGWTYRICLNDGQTLYYTIFGNNGYTNQTTRPTTTQLTTTQADKHEESAKPQQSGPLIRKRVK